MRAAVIALLAGVLLLAAPRLGRADPELLPYNYAHLEERISVVPHDGSRMRLDAGSGAELLDYREVEYYDRYAMATVAGRQAFVAVLLLYTSAAVYIVEPGLLVPADHVTTLSAQLPERASLLRLLVFDRQPDRKTLVSFAARPASTRSRYLLGELWLRTYAEPSVRSGVLMPWEENFEFFPRLSGSRSRWPYALARLDSSLQVRAKGCHVRYSGLPTVEIGTYGPVGAWPLEIAESLRLGFNLPQQVLYRRAALLTVADPPGAEFEVRVNGFLVPVIPDEHGVALAGGVDIRSYLQGGANEIELRAPTFGQGGRLQRVELWLD